VEACLELGLLEEDTHWNHAMEEAALAKSPSQLRNLFAILMATCGLNSPVEIWNQHKENMTEDFLYQARQQNPDINVAFTEGLFNKTLLIFEDKIMAMNGNSLSVYGSPKPTRGQDERISRDVLRETSYDVENLKDFILSNEPKLTPDQRAAYVKISAHLNTKKGGVFS